MTLKSQDQKWSLAQWLSDRASSGNGEWYAIAITSPCHVCQPRVARHLTDYLNEFDVESDGNSWWFLDDRKLADLTDSALSASLDDSNNLPKLPEGHLVIETTTGKIGELDSDQIFQVYLSCTEPETQNHHLWLNAKKIDPGTLTNIIAGSFIEWTERDRAWSSRHEAPSNEDEA